MLWKNKNCTIKSLTGRWDRKAISRIPLRIDDQCMHFSGLVLSTHHTPETEGMIEFSITTTSLKPANMILTVASNDAVDVLLEIVDCDIKTNVQIEPSDDSRNFRGKKIDFNITEAATCVRTLKIRLQCKLHNTDGEFYVLLEDKNESLLGLKINQEFNITYFLSMLSIQANLWLVLFAVLFLIAAHIPFIQNIDRQHAEIGSTVIMFLTLLGLPNLMRLPVKLRPQALLRRISCFFRRSPKLSLSILSIILLFSYIYVHSIFECMSIKNKYTNYISRYIDSGKDSGQISDLIQAFSLIPHRQEAMILIEDHLLSLSTETPRSPLRTVAAQFLDDKSVKKSITAPTETYHNCLCECSEPPFDPELWYATVLPMAESHHDKKRKQEARELLGGRNDPKARLFSYILDLEINDTNKKTEEIIKKIADIINHDEIQDSHLLQEAADHIAYYKARQCAVDEAIEWYSLLLANRKSLASSRATDKKWMRTPRKLSLFHIFRALDSKGKSGETIDKARKLLERCNSGDPEKDLKSRLRQLIYEDYKSFQDEDYWFIRTWVRRKGEGNGNDTQDMIKQELSKCWRY